MFDFELLDLAVGLVIASIVFCFWHHFGSAKLRKSGSSQRGFTLRKPAPPPEEVYGTDAALVDKDIAELCALWREHMPEDLQQEKHDLKLAILAREYIVSLAMALTDLSIQDCLGWWNSRDFAKMADELMKTDVRARNHARAAHQKKLDGAALESFIEYGKALHVWGYGPQHLLTVKRWLSFSEPLKPYAG